MRLKLNHTITKKRGQSISFFCDIDGQHLPSIYISQTAPVTNDGIMDGDIYDVKLSADIKKLAQKIHTLVEKFNKGEL